MDAAVVDEAQVLVAVLLEQLVGLERVDVAAEQMADVAVAVPRVVVLEPAGVVVEQQLRRAGVRDLSKIVLPSRGTRSPVSQCSSPSITIPAPASNA